MTADEMIRFNTSGCITLLTKEVDTKILDGVYTISQKCELDFNEEQIKELLLMFTPMQEELKVYKKAYEMLAEAYCDKGECSKCYCKNSCIEFNGIKNGYAITKDFFLQKARCEE